MNDVGDLVCSIERHLMRTHECVTGFPMLICQTGEEYEELSAIGDYPETALLSLSMKIAEYCIKKEGRLYWRLRPYVEKSDNSWKSRTRLIVSERTPKWLTMDDYESHVHAMSNLKKVG